MNDEYIKREAVIKGFTDLLQKPGDIYPTDITTMMQRVPAEDVRPVVRGEWVYLYDKNYKCSECGEWYSVDVTPIEEGMFYCPNCGADMRGE
jgi:predicted RNA-binding Zn-ribbon protein involved in translation (DUF1610 family)